MDPHLKLCKLIILHTSAIQETKQMYTSEITLHLSNIQKYEFKKILQSLPFTCFLSVAKAWVTENVRALKQLVRVLVFYFPFLNIGYQYLFNL